VLDLQGDLEERPLALHGLQVALATILAAEVYRRLLTELEPAEVNVDACYPSAETMRQRIEKAFAEVDASGKVGQEVWGIYQKKLDTWHGLRDQFEAVLSDWPAFREKIEETWRTPERTAQILRAVGSPMTFDALIPAIPEEQVKFAFMNGVLMRGRFTIGDLLLFLQWDREALWQQAWDMGQKVAERA
jgi:glycerol dehydrogenase-like iron-containing ADH family enzyme